MRHWPARRANPPRCRIGLRVLTPGGIPAVKYAVSKYPAAALRLLASLPLRLRIPKDKSLRDPDPRTNADAGWFARLKDREARARILVRIRRCRSAIPVTRSRWVKASPSSGSNTGRDIACISSGAARR